VTFVFTNNNGPDISGNRMLTLTAPTTGTTKGVLFYLPYGNKSSIKFNGTADSTYTGTFLAPDAQLELLGDFGTNTHGQFAAGTIYLSGNSSGTITYNAGENWEFPSPPVIELTK
jgi:hypothetical protein